MYEFENQRERKTERQRQIYQMLHSPVGFSGWGWTRWKPGAFSESPAWVAGSQVLGAASAALLDAFARSSLDSYWRSCGKMASKAYLSRLWPNPDPSLLKK